MSLAYIWLNLLAGVLIMDERVELALSIATAAPKAARRTIREIVSRSIPDLADFCVVFVVAGRRIVGVASAHANPDGNRVLRALQRTYRVRRADLQSTVAQVVRTGRPLIRRTILPESHPRPAPRGSVEDLHRRLACRSALVLPIRVGRNVFGAVSLCYAGSGRTYTKAAVQAGGRVAREIARAVAPPELSHGAVRVRTATGNTRREATVRRRVVSRD
jgi:GAF domain-containing protein